MALSAKKVPDPWSTCYGVLLSLIYELKSELWAALSGDSAVVGPLSLLCCEKDRRQSGQRSALWANFQPVSICAEGERGASKYLHERLKQLLPTYPGVPHAVDMTSPLPSILDSPKSLIIILDSFWGLKYNKFSGCRKKERKKDCFNFF